MRLPIWGFVAAAFLCEAPPAVAQSPLYVDQCYDRKGERFSIEERVGGCTTTIRSGRYSGKDLAWAYNNRGNAWRVKGELDRAMDDCNEAIRLDPKYAHAYVDRAGARYLRGRYAAAIADYTQAVQLDPNAAVSLYWRGKSKQRNGDNAGGDVDIAAARRIDPRIGTAAPLADQIEQRLQRLHGAQKPSTPNPNMLTASEVQALIKRISECWQVPKGVRNRPDLRVTVRVKLTKDGSLAEPPKVLNSNPDPQFAVAVKSAIAGLTRCAPFSFLPAAKYAAWQDITIDLDPL
jgi:tetratricopeptide (TPR) repeat protein